MPLDLAQCMYLDFEARSEVNIKDVGAHAYAAHPTTELLCCAWVVGTEDEVHLWLPGEPFPQNGQGRVWVAQNKDTERFLLKYKLGIEVHEWVDLAEVSSAAGMPRNLHDMAEALHLPVGKLAKTALLTLSKPRKLTKTNKEKWWTPETKPDLYAQLYDYCKRDTDLLRLGLKALPPFDAVMPPKERRLSKLTDRMNDLGVEVDIKGVQLAQQAVAEHTTILRAEFDTLLPGVNPRSPKVVAEHLGIANVRKETVRDELKDTFQDPARFRTLEILKTLKTSSTAKLEAFIERIIDGRLHGSMVFHGAGRTGRWSSMGVQLQNLVRGLGAGTPDWPAIDTEPGAMERAFEALHAGALDVFYENPIRTVAAMMRGFLLDSGAGLLSGDYSQIEARTLATWAGQTDLVEAFRQKKDPYKMMAARIYQKEETVITKDERFMGKQTVLGAGFGVGKHGLQRMLAEIYGIHVSLEEAERIVHAYRAASPRVVALWYAVDRLAKQVILEQPQRFVSHPSVPKIGMRMYRKWLVIRLPSNRCLWYFEPELTEGDHGGQIFYWGRDITKGGRWDRVKTYGGKLVENVTQAIARDVMAEGMLRLEDAGFTPLLTVHDEVVAPGPEEKLDEFESLMRQAPAWWPELPLDVEVQWTRRYQK